MKTFTKGEKFRLRAPMNVTPVMSRAYTNAASAARKAGANNEDVGMAGLNTAYESYRYLVRQGKKFPKLDVADMTKKSKRRNKR